jgi:hypothetical protein
MNKDEQVLKNLDIAEDFLHQILDHPEALEGRDGTTIVLVPDTDPELADANMTTARELVQRCPNCGSRSDLKDSEADYERTGGVYLQPVCSRVDAASTSKTPR